MAASDEARRCLQKASQDEYVLARLLEDPAAPDEQLGFHAQQAVEKLLKAALFLVGGQPPRTHHLAQLEALLAVAGQPLPIAFQPLLDLTPFAVQWRYEDDPGPPMTVEERRSLLADIQRLRKRAEGLLPPERLPNEG
jgi:HEPN domain-containing protein